MSDLRQQAGLSQRQDPPPALWVAFHYDLSAFAVFTRELLALRYAVDNGMQVKKAKYGEDLRKQVLGDG